MIDLKPACEQMIVLVEAVAADQLADPTPCADYRVRDLLAHVDTVSTGLVAAAPPAGEPAPLSFDGPWKAQLSDRVRNLGVAWADPAAWDGLSDRAGRQLPNQVWGKIVLTELVVHGWDVATATGQSLDLPEPTLRACLDHVADFVPRAPIPQLWGRPAAVADDAPLIDRIVGITGRTPRPSPPR